MQEAPHIDRIIQMFISQAYQISTIAHFFIQYHADKEIDAKTLGDFTSLIHECIYYTRTYEDPYFIYYRIFSNSPLLK